MSDSLNVMTLIQGELAISDDSSMVFSTLLGSCISVCLYDPYAGVGGMNHFLLPGMDCAGAASTTTYLYGVNAMDELVRRLLNAGCMKERLECKAFGGASVLSIASNIGQENVAFLWRYLQSKNLSCVAYSLGGHKVRRIRFWPTTGKVLQYQCQPTSSV
ncbi:chemotaxis protein CheD [Bombella saccharophila]|uniref:Probable chemoreceptor glutamine deamidase CheD n=1 Tax=Bombella saccharophila TaxID=2967338 RepID=A0ABT3W7C2_9PROT|nr:chemotaxis protein CheD [Bombella saccharophila]MCX5614980.1 chemotaxis protein CheD [Bombella saccharophila]PHI96319.1 chemotaxis protein CheD [Parasaccharibacter apium]